MRGTKQISFVASAKTHRHSWYLVDATDKILGRLATRIATILMGKHKPTYTPFLDTGDFVIVTNAAKVKFTGKKLDQKMHKTFSRYPGGQKETPLRIRMAKQPQEVVRHAVLDMLPRGTLGRRQIFKLKVYAGADHPHQAQNPEPVEFK